MNSVQVDSCELEDIHAGMCCDTGWGGGSVQITPVVMLEFSAGVMSEFSAGAMSEFTAVLMSVQMIVVLSVKSLL